MLPVLPLIVSALVIRGATKAVVAHIEARERQEREAVVRAARARARREARKAREALAAEQRSRARRLDRAARDPRVDPDVSDRLRRLAREQRQTQTPSRSRP